MALGKKTKAYMSLAEKPALLVDGVVISIDPSIGSGSNGSNPAYAVYERAQFKYAAAISIPAKANIVHKLQALAEHVQTLYNYYRPDVLVYEDIPAQSHGRGAVGHASLLKAVGAILSVPGPEHYVGIMPVSWKKLARPEYVKSDENDAIEIGYIAIEEAKKIIKEKVKKLR